MGTILPFPAAPPPLSAVSPGRRNTAMIAGYLEQRLQCEDREEGRKCRAILRALNGVNAGGNPLGIELAAVAIGPRAVGICFRMPGGNRIQALPAIRLNATDRLREVVRVTSAAWRPAPLRTKTGNAPKRPGPPRKVVIKKVEARLIPGVRS